MINLMICVRFGEVLSERGAVNPSSVAGVSAVTFWLTDRYACGQLELFVLLNADICQRLHQCAYFTRRP